MIRQHICIPQYNWCVDILYNVRPKDTDYILGKLWDMGCSQRDMRHAEDLLLSGIPNEGLTYSDKRNGTTLICIGHTTSIGEFINSLHHEINHLEAHICEAYGINMHSEDAAYLSGDLAQIIYQDAMKTALRLFYRING